MLPGLRRTATPLAAWLGALVLTLAACGSRVDRASFSRIETDMPEADVFAILGEPRDTSSFSLGGLSATSSTWEGSDGTIVIQFVNGKVKLKTFTQGAGAE